MDNSIFYDKILGCWIGKCVGGNIGAPYEGMKQRLPIEYSEEAVKKVIPNDDLDLQILWLDVLQKKGWDITALDLAESFYNNCPYAPGEYAYFKKNYKKGIAPPLSGTFNNTFFTEGMGAPIRSEIWACIYADKPNVAIRYARMDAEIDHNKDKDAVNGEIFLTALECLCFNGGEPRKLVENALEYLPECKLKNAILDLLLWTNEEENMEVIMNKVLRKYGHSESCMARQNICILVGAFLLHGENFIDAIMEAVRCGFDADCTCATLGSIIGILLGGEKLKKLFGVSDMTYKLGVKSQREDFTVSGLAQDVYDLALKFKDVVGETRRWQVFEENIPTISMGENKTVILRIDAPKGAKKHKISLRMEQPAIIDRSEIEFDAEKQREITFNVFLPDFEIVPAGLVGEVFLDDVKIGMFGLSVNRRWKVYGPFWKNEVVIPPLKDGLTYGKFIPREGTRESLLDHMRLFHLSCLPDNLYDENIDELNGEYLIEDTEEDVVDVDKHTYFFGNATYYFKTEFYSNEEMKSDMQIGRNVPIKVWLNGEVVAEKDGNETFYHEVIHKLSLPIRKGKNELIFRIVKNTEYPKFSFDFVTAGPCSDHRLFDLVNCEK